MGWTSTQSASRRQLLASVAAAGSAALAGCTTEIEFATRTTDDSGSKQTEWTGTVTEVVDGDTLDIRAEDGTVHTVRLLGVDTPEVHVETDPAEWEGIPESEAGREWLSDWGQQASQWVTGQVKGESVTFRTDAEADRRGYYDRLITYVYYDGQLLNRRLLEDGFARFYDTTFQKDGGFAETEESAREQDIGVWDYS